MTRAGLPARAFSDSRSSLLRIASCRPNGDCSEAAQLRRLREARELQEELVHVLPDLVGAGEEAVVRVAARGLRVVVAGAQMAIAADAARLTPHDEE